MLGWQVCLLAAACLVGIPLAAVDNPFLEQLQAFRKLASVRADIAIVDASIPAPMHDRFMAKGRYWKEQRSYLAAGGKDELQDAGFILCDTKLDHSFLDLVSGSLRLSHRDPTTGEIAGRRMPFGKLVTIPLIGMFTFLSYKDGKLDSPNLEWGDLWNEKLLNERAHQLVKKRCDDGHGGSWVTIPFLTTRNAGPVDEGDYHDVHIEAPVELKGAHVISEIVTRGKSDGDSFANRIAYAYRLVRINGGANEIPLLLKSEMFTPDSKGKAVITVDVTMIDCTSKVDDAELEIDPVLAKTITDLSTGHDVEPAR